MKKILIIGSGGIAQRHLRGFLKTEQAELAVVEPDRTKRELAAATYPLIDTWADIKDAPLSAFDGAVITAPAHVHVPLAMTCAKAGLPVLLEKPLSVTWDGVDELLSATRDLVCRVGYIRRSGPEMQYLHQASQAGTIGTPKLLYVNTSQEFPKYRPDYRDTYYARPEMGGGAILDAASHSIDVAIWLLGEPVEVSCLYDHLVLPDVEVEDTCLLSIRFASGAMAQININQFQKPNISTFDLIGTTGNLTYNGANSSITHFTDDSGQGERRTFLDGMSLMEAHEARFKLQAEQFMGAIDGQPCGLATVADAALNLKVALAAKQADREKRVIQL